MTIHPADLDFAVAEHIVERDTDPALVALVRERVAALLLLGPSPSQPTTPRDRAVADFVDQFVIDVSGIDDTLRGPLFEQLGDDAMGFVQALYVIDLGIRRREVLARLGTAVPDVGDVTVAADAQLWPALLQYMRTVARMKALDPVTSEFVRLRGAAAHDCRICKSRLSVQAVEAFGSSDAFNSVVASHPTELSDRHAVALAFVDAIITQPTELDTAMVAKLRAHFSPTELHEMLHDVVRNSSNKFAVAVGGDAAVVDEGFEYYDIDADGDVVADVDREVVRALTRA
ncbi:MAG: carboxymuconolactone decarboxylase family protein [Actinobacteria bacterium]|nr:MAG: carboxymuconolactone decarboxylase family protein [Actinomycetota bacterium]